MGFWSSVGSALSSAASSFCSAVSSVCSAIGGSFFNGAGGIGSIVTSIIGTTIPSLGQILSAIETIGKIVSFIAELLGLKEEDETTEELGYKAHKSDKKPEDFETTEEYVTYLREEVEVDQEEFENLSPEEKAMYAAMGVAIHIKAIEEKYDIQAPGEFWRTVADRNMSGEEVNQYIKSMKEEGITDMKDVSDYLNGKDPESGTSKSKVSSAIMDAMKELEPDLSDDQLAQKFNDMIQTEG